MNLLRREVEAGGDLLSAWVDHCDQFHILDRSNHSPQGLMPHLMRGLYVGAKAPTPKRHVRR
jgi:hypothetical protein